jgi:hypothetical protein
MARTTGARLREASRAAASRLWVTVNEMSEPHQTTSRTRLPGAEQPAKALRHEIREQRLILRLTRLLDAVDGAAEEWLAAARDEEMALDRWREATPEDRRVAGAAFVAALEREEKAASAYRSVWEAWCAAAG